jgi:hypothetical protein
MSQKMLHQLSYFSRIVLPIAVYRHQHRGSSFYRLQTTFACGKTRSPILSKVHHPCSGLLRNLGCVVLRTVVHYYHFMYVLLGQLNHLPYAQGFVVGGHHDYYFWSNIG